MRLVTSSWHALKKMDHIVVNRRHLLPYRDLRDQDLWMTLDRPADLFRQVERKIQEKSYVVSKNPNLHPMTSNTGTKARTAMNGDGKIYLNDDGEACKIDKRGVPYKVGSDGRRICSYPTT